MFLTKLQKSISQDNAALKIQKLSKIKNNEFNNQLKILLGKSVDDNEFENLTNLKDQDFKDRINLKFSDARSERINILDKEKTKAEEIAKGGQPARIDRTRQR